MQFTLQIQCDSAAFEPAPTAEVARILRELADNLEDMEVRPCDASAKRLHDENGNKVGFAQFIDD